MSSLTVTLILFSLLLLLLFLNVPLVVSIGLPTALIMLGSGMKVATLAQRTYASVDSFTLMAIPFFMLAGKLMEVGGMSKRIVRLADCLVGWMAGGLAHVIVVASAFFGALSGLSLIHIFNSASPRLSITRRLKSFSFRLIKNL